MLRIYKLLDRKIFHILPGSTEMEVDEISYEKEESVLIYLDKEANVGLLADVPAEQLQVVLSKHTTADQIIELQQHKVSKFNISGNTPTDAIASIKRQDGTELQISLHGSTNDHKLPNNVMGLIANKVCRHFGIGETTPIAAVAAICGQGLEVTLAPSATEEQIRILTQHNVKFAEHTEEQTVIIEQIRKELPSAIAAASEKPKNCVTLFNGPNGCSLVMKANGDTTLVRRRSLNIGDRVIVSGLKYKPELNDYVATIVTTMNAKNGRYGVKMNHLGDNAKPIAIKPENLNLLDGSTCKFDDSCSATWHSPGI
jgi:hypothetical protein